MNLSTNIDTGDANVLQVFGENIYINGTTISRMGHMMIGLATDSSQGVVQWENNEQGNLYIQKVVGYR